MLFSLNHDLDPSRGNARIRVDRCPTTYFSGRCSYLGGQGDTDEEGRQVLQSHRRRRRSRGPNCRWAGWHSFGHAELGLTIMLGDRGRFDCPWQTALVPIRSLLHLCLRWLASSVWVNVHNRLAGLVGLVNVHNRLADRRR
jgi:hypothetical protein